MFYNLIVWTIVGILLSKTYKVFIEAARKEGISFLVRILLYWSITIFCTIFINAVAPLEGYSLLAYVIGFITQDILEQNFNKD